MKKKLRIFFIISLVIFGIIFYRMQTTIDKYDTQQKVMEIAQTINKKIKKDIKEDKKEEPQILEYIEEENNINQEISNSTPEIYTYEEVQEPTPEVHIQEEQQIQKIEDSIQHQPQVQEQYTSLGTYKITAYCSCQKCTGSGNGITASGTQATAGRTIAAPSNLPFGTKLLINGHEYIVEDRGGAIKNNVLDMYFDDHEQALQWGVKYIEVFIKNY